MKKLILALALFTGFSTNAQSDGGLFLDFGIGTRFGGVTTESTVLQTGLAIDGGLGYMFNNKFGVRGGLTFANFNAVDVNNEAVSDRAATIQASLQGILSISQLANFGTEKFDLNFHAGFGFGTVFNPDFKEDYVEMYGEFDDPMFKGNDDVVNVVFGLTPRFPINEKLTVMVDVSHYLLLNQDHFVDRRYSNAQLENGTTGFTTTTVGLSLNL